MAAIEQSEFTIHLQIRVIGPDADWDVVADKLAERIDGMALRDGYRVMAAEIDEAALD